MALSLSRSVAAAVRPTAGRRALSVRVMAADKTTMIKEAVAANKVVVFSKTYCPYCTRVKSLFSELNVDAKVFELDNMGAEGADIQDSLQTITGRRTVPQVFVGTNFVGGCDDTVAAHGAGKLVPMLQTAGAV